MGAIAIVTPFLVTCALESWSWKRRTSGIRVTVVGSRQTVIGYYGNKQMNLDHNKIRPEETAYIWRRYYCMVSPPNDVWETSAEIPYWWRASNWLKQISHAARPISSTTQMWEVRRPQYRTSALVSQASFGGETSGSVSNCRLYSQAK